MSGQAGNRALVVVFDALRPEFVTPELMPNLHAFAEGGVRYPNSHSIFLTETRVNQTGVVTGCLPSRNGIVANVMMADDVWSDRILNTGIEDEIRAAFETTGGQLIQVPTLSERLSAAGLKYATLSAGTPGGGRLLNHCAQDNGSFRFAMRSPKASHPPDVLDQIAAKIGPMPGYERPATAWISWAVDAYLNWVEPNLSPDLMLLWLCEPDETFHYHGIGSDPSLVTMRHADQEFARILAQHEAEVARGEMQIVAMSDHGQITLEGEAVDVSQCLIDAGFKAAKSPGDDVDYVVIIHNGGGIWVRDNDPELADKVVAFLVEQDWCGPVFTRDGNLGTLKLGEVCLTHNRAPTIAVTMRTRDEVNEFGRAGLTRHQSPYPVGGGCHGGLSRYELNNFMCLSGSAFKTGTVIDAPSGNIDIAPTLCRLLGLDIASEVDGRVLAEAFLDGDAPAEWQDRTLVAQNSAGVRTHLSVTDMAGVRYLNRAWVE
ncbi:MAG: alkaline phosphatase family protein [Pseudomonadota bacterium]